MLVLLLYSYFVSFLFAPPPAVQKERKKVFARTSSCSAWQRRLCTPRRQTARSRFLTPAWSGGLIAFLLRAGKQLERCFFRPLGKEAASSAQPGGAEASRSGRGAAPAPREKLPK